MENKIEKKKREKKGKDRLIYKHLSTSTGDTTPQWATSSTTENVQKNIYHRLL